LESEVQRLTDIEAIQALKCRYWYCIDNQSWDEIGDCFADDAEVDYGMGIKLQGRRLIVRFFKRIVGSYFSASAHLGHNPEIKLTGANAAIGRWELDQFGIERETNRSVRIGTTYSDEYIKQEGRWKIKSTREVYHYQEILNLGEINLTGNPGKVEPA
jgi:hypothetical protein